MVRQRGVGDQQVHRGWKRAKAPALRVAEEERLLELRGGGLAPRPAERYLTVFEESWRCYPDVQPCLETLKRLPRGPRLAVLTNGDPEQQRAKLARFGLLEYFEAVLTSTELGAAKPVAYATACRWMRTDPAQAVNVGDMLESDVNAAALAGLTGIWLDRGIDFVTGGPSPTAAETVFRIERLTDLPPPITHERLTGSHGRRKVNDPGQ
ncbi:HAD family hydrolase [Nonomuraea sp. SYSU D8015]|uniref:HAD family hydrolase n=1 Tax=Nonomuraea sp. SYSU D8015 TaxID=2593644 RepID=UPI00300D7190